MADPFLDSHSVAPLVLDIGGRLYPISIRDQMVRARMTVDRALEVGLIQPASPRSSVRPLLVIGAGAAGATAAMYSAARGVPTLLIDAAQGPFGRQAGCTTRWIDPVQYDWPLTHWQTGRYPWTLPAMPLPWLAGPANRIAVHWTRALNRARRNPRLHFQYPAQVAGTPALLRTATGPFLGVSLATPGGTPLFRSAFGLMVSCIGAGTEKSTHGPYSGFNFWATDPFQSLTPRDRVLISGGGDGALQDYLRVVTQQSSAKAIYTGLGIPSGIEHYLQSAEDQAGRVYIWGSDGRHDHGALLRLHETHQSIVDRLLPSSGTSSPVPGLLNALASLTAKAPEILLLYPCSHFSRCYALNRFLVLLLATYLEQVHGRATLLPRQRLEQVQGVGHTCSGNPNTCHSQPHDVTTSSVPDCRTSRSPGSPAASLGRFNVVIIRHGIAASPPLQAGARPIQQPRQILPYHVG